jgi:Phage tail tube protein, GTA-gp10
LSRKTGSHFFAGSFEEDHMTNPRRGEVALLADGKSRAMRLTLAALAELETSFAVDNLAALGERFGSGQLSSRDVIRILGAGLRGAGARMEDGEVAALAFDEGLAGAIRAAVALLEATFGAASERPTALPEPEK